LPQSEPLRTFHLSEPFRHLVEAHFFAQVSTPAVGYPLNLSAEWPFMLRKPSTQKHSVGDTATIHRAGKSMNDAISIMRAADAAARWHVHQRRKGSAQEPYINHLLEVATLVAQATGGTEQDVVIAALLHDAIEDQNVAPETVASEFGQCVADVVIEVTDDKSLPKAERKRQQVESAPKKTHAAKLIKLADKTSNVRAVANSPAPHWSVERRFEYVEWAKNVVAGLRGISPWLEEQFDEAVKQAMRSLDAPDRIKEFR
jgi:guanosine-3',5'-bis(diphosphate) 3'-pyrophosphohydrolase